ncbi:transposable element Tcb1 transposase [Trichonephila clavipes]|uniref:Transposable element Tcb1 transposase n=1 Tax=Trichonephila clavipes TaxID=2585209 RepID=A0A8X6WHH5_TRICX|nr:transposable element Tcb1 transposase [Trichonephila clavipes]
MLGSCTDLHIFDAGSVNGTRYCNEILLPYERLFRGAMGLQFLFMDDNAPCHRTVAAEQLLESEDIERMDWPARSPDLNPIEHVWDFLGRRLAARTLPPVTIRELRLALQDEWAAMPQQLIDTLILSMGRRCETCLHKKTGCFLLDTLHRDVSAFSRIALHATFSIKLLFIPLISLLLRETKLPVRLINITNERRLVQGHETTTLRVKEDIDDASSELDSGVKACTSWMKHPKFYCSQRVRHLKKPVQDL